jgi:hypothetical protein
MVWLEVVLVAMMMGVRFTVAAINLLALGSGREAQGSCGNKVL